MAQRARMVCALGLAFAALAATRPAAADFSTETVTVPLQNTDFTTTVLLPQFRPKPYIMLDSVSLSFQGKISTTDTLTFVNQATLTATSTATLTLTGPDHLSLTVAPSATASQTGSSGSITTTATGTATATQPATSDPTLLALFTGTSNVDFTLTTTALSQTHSTSGNGSFAGSSQAGGVLTATFQFHAVPEPASLALLTLGIGGVMISARHRRRRHAPPDRAA